MKYSYDRSEIKKISLSGFLSMVSVRNKRISAAPDDFKFGWVHPCASFPRSDVELEIFPG